MPIKIFIYTIMAIILISLASALYFLLTKKADPFAMVKALTVRIGLSLFLFFVLLLAFMLGWIKPHGITEEGNYVQTQQQLQ